MSPSLTISTKIHQVLTWPWLRDLGNYRQVCTMLSIMTVLKNVCVCDVVCVCMCRAQEEEACQSGQDSSRHEAAEGAVPGPADYHS